MNRNHLAILPLVAVLAAACGKDADQPSSGSAAPAAGPLTLTYFNVEG